MGDKIITPKSDYGTDTIEDVLKNNRGEFSRYLIDSGLTDGIECLNLWRKVDNLINNPNSVADFQKSVNALFNDANNIQEIKLAVMDKLHEAIKSGDKSKIINALQSLKNALQNAMRREFQTFQRK